MRSYDSQPPHEVDAILLRSYEIYLVAPSLCCHQMARSVCVSGFFSTPGEVAFRLLVAGSNRAFEMCQGPWRWTVKDSRVMVG